MIFALSRRCQAQAQALMYYSHIHNISFYNIFSLLFMFSFSFSSVLQSLLCVLSACSAECDFELKTQSKFAFRLKFVEKREKNEWKERNAKQRKALVYFEVEVKFCSTNNVNNFFENEEWQCVYNIYISICPLFYAGMRPRASHIFIDKK